MNMGKPIAIALSMFYIFPVAANADDPERENCTSLPLLARYERAGLATRSADGNVQLHLIADLHFADCGAPDCYGTDIMVTLELVPQRGRCLLKAAVVTTQEFAETDCGDADLPSRPTTETYTARSGQADLSANLERITLRNRDNSKALVIMRQNFFYFDNVTPGGVLRTTLAAGDENEGCCRGATSSEVHFLQAGE